MRNTQRPEDCKPVCACQCHAIPGIDDMLYMPHMSALILSNLYSTPAASQSLAASVVHSAIASAVNGQFTTPMVSLPAFSPGNTRGDCGKMVVMALSRKKGGASCLTEKAEWGSSTIDFQLQGPQMDFSLNHVATMPEMNG